MVTIIWGFTATLVTILCGSTNSYIGYHSLWIYKQLHWLPFFVDIQTATLVFILSFICINWLSFWGYTHPHSYISFELLLLHIQLHWFPLTISLDSWGLYSYIGYQYFQLYCTATCWQPCSLLVKQLNWLSILVVIHYTSTLDWSFVVKQL